MSFRRVILHVLVWSGIFICWLLTTRQFHPNVAIAAAATSVLVCGSALVVYLNSLFLLPRFLRRGRHLQYLLALSATLIILDLTTVLVIQAIYDVLWHPDPLRFGFWFNMLSDGFIIALHLIAAMGVVRMATLLRRRTQARPARG